MRHIGPLDEAERQVVAETYLPLRRFAAVVAPPEVDPDDVVQEAYLRVLRRGPLSRLDHPLRYLRRTVVNLSSNHRRRLGTARRATSRLQPETETTAHYPSDLSDLAALSPDVRAVLYLADVEGFPFEAVAEMVGCSVAAAKKRASRGRKLIQQALMEESR